MAVWYIITMRSIRSTHPTVPRKMKPRLAERDGYFTRGGFKAP